MKIKELLEGTTNEMSAHKLEEAEISSVCSRLSKQLKPILNDLGQYTEDANEPKYRRAVNMAWDNIKAAIAYLELKK